MTHYGEFNLADLSERSELAQAVRRALCRMSHPCMQGRAVELPAELRPRLLSVDKLPEPLA
ncbi:MAG: hypothetical protein ACT4OM_02350 [Actinomycetota bacterium]